MHILSISEYHDFILKKSIYIKGSNTKIPNLVLGVYKWVEDFTDRRTIRQNWEQYLNESDKNIFMNESYEKLNKSVEKYGEISYSDIDKLIEQLQSISGIRDTFQNIDDDIKDDIKSTWLYILSKSIQSKNKFNF